MKNYKKQTGAVLLWSLVILVVLLVLGVTSIRMSGLDTRIAGNEMHSMLTYQAAESAIARIVSASTARLFHLDATSKAPNRTTEWSGMRDRVSLDNTAVDVTSKADVFLPAWGEKVTCPTLTGLANSVNASYSAGGMDCQVYVVTAKANLQGASAKSQHDVGIFKFIPASTSH